MLRFLHCELPTSLCTPSGCIYLIILYINYNSKMIIQYHTQKITIRVNLIVIFLDTTSHVPTKRSKLHYEIIYFIPTQQLKVA